MNTPLVLFGKVLLIGKEMYMYELLQLTQDRHKLAFDCGKPVESTYQLPFTLFFMILIQSFCRRS